MTWHASSALLYCVFGRTVQRLSNQYEQTFLALKPPSAPTNNRQICMRRLSFLHLGSPRPMQGKEPFSNTDSLACKRSTLMPTHTASTAPLSSVGKHVCLEVLLVCFVAFSVIRLTDVIYNVLMTTVVIIIQKR